MSDLPPVVTYHELGHRYRATRRLRMRPQLNGATLGGRSMLSEDSVPEGDRVLVLHGVAAPAVLARLQPGLAVAPSPTARVFFVGFAYADLPIGKRFEFAFPKGHAYESVATVAQVVAVTQQWGKPFDGIPHGWKTICFFEFPEGVPEMVDALPVVEGWHGSEQEICLTNEDGRRANRSNTGTRANW
jgi:hypothetical protein